MPTWVLTNVTTGVVLTDYVDVDSLQLADRAYANTSRLSFTVRDEASAITIANEHEILLEEDGVKAFAGLVRVLEKTDTGVSGQRIYAVECQDYTTLMSEDFAVPSGARTTVETDKARIAWLFTTFGGKGINAGTASVVQLKATMPDQDFTGKSLHECMTMIAAVTGGSFYVDYNKVLHYFNTETNAAPFGLSDNPNGSTTFGYEDFRETSDSVDQINAVYVIGKGVSGWRPASPPALATRRATVIVDDQITTAQQIIDRGDALLATYSVLRKPSSLVTHKPGLRAGMYVQVTHSGWGISAVSYRVQSVAARLESKDRLAYTINFGNAPVDFGSLLAGISSGVAVAQSAALSASTDAAKVNDLSVAGANLVANSSFEDGTAWAVGSNWTIGFNPGAGLAFWGDDVARLVTSSSTGGDLITGDIPVARLDDYWFSFWHWVRSRSSGTLRAAVLEYNSAGTLLATNVIDIAATDSDWTRKTLHFANTAATGVIAWQATTAKVRIRFNTTGSSTMTADIDGVQLERGKLLTAYAPKPQELIEGSVGPTKIADDAITTPKLAANAVAAGKIAAGVVTAAELASNAVTADKIAAGAITIGKIFDPLAGGNLISNPSFEADGDTAGGDPITGWTAAAGDELQVQTGPSPKSGTYALRIAQTATPAGRRASTADFLPVEANRTYKMGCWARGLGGNSAGATARIRVTWYDIAKVSISSTSDSLVVGSGATFLAIDSFKISADGAAFAKITLENDAASGASDVVYFDDVEFFRADRDSYQSSGDVVIDKTGIAIHNGKLSIDDQYGIAGVLTGAGFGGSWLDFITLGLYNARFLAGVVGAIPEGSYSANLPYWKVASDASSAVTYLSGGAIRASFTSLTYASVTSAAVPVRPNTGYGVEVTRTVARSAGDLVIRVYIQWYDATGAAIGSPVYTGVATDDTASISTARTDGYGYIKSPATAQSATVELRLTEEGTHNAANTITVWSVGFIPAPVPPLSTLFQQNMYTGADTALTTTASMLIDVNIEKGHDYLVIAETDFDVSVSGVTACVAELYYDSTGGSGGSLISGAPVGVWAPATTGRGQVTIAWRVTIAAGSGLGQIMTKIRKTGAGGTAVAKSNRCTILAMALS